MRVTAVLRQVERSNTIGFVGLGAMGNCMFNNIVRKFPAQAGEKVNFTVYDVNENTVREVIARHKSENPHAQITAASSPAELAFKSSKIISMVPTSKHVRDVYLEENGVIAALRKLDKKSVEETLCLDQSTIEQSESRDIASTIKATGAEMVDAPVSGVSSLFCVVGADNGTLAIMVGGSESAFKQSVPVLQPMARKIVHCGDLGAGLAAKIANNLLLGITMLGLSEAMLLGKRLGLDSQILADIINSSTGRCWSSEINNPVPGVAVGDQSPPAHRQYAGGFVTKLTHKDLGLAVDAAKTSGTPLPLGNLTEQTYRPLATDATWGNLDFSVIYKYLDEVAAAR